jgi:hypothetical protein
MVREQADHCHCDQNSSNMVALPQRRTPGTNQQACSKLKVQRKKSTRSQFDRTSTRLRYVILSSSVAWQSSLATLVTSHMTTRRHQKILSAGLAAHPMRRTSWCAATTRSRWVFKGQASFIHVASFRHITNTLVDLVASRPKNAPLRLCVNP